MDISEILAAQDRIIKTIKLIESECKLTCKTKTVSSAFLNRKQSSLDEFWIKFNKNNDEICVLCESKDTENEEYFVNDYYNSTRLLVDEIFIFIESAIQSCTTTVKHEQIDNKEGFSVLNALQLRVKIKFDNALGKARDVIGKHACQSLLIFHIDEITKVFSQFEENDDRLQELASLNQLETNPYFINHVCEQVRADYTTCKTDLEEERLQRFPFNANGANEQHHNHKIHLPPISIPTFTGNYQAWPTFIDLFD